MGKKAVSLFLLLTPFLVIALFNHPSLDDFWNANTIIGNGRLKAVSYSFNHFSGRYFSTFLMSMLNTLPQGKIWIFKLFPILICMSLTGALFYLIKMAFKTGNRETITFAIMLTLLHILNMRVLYEGLYWMSATVTYQVGIIIYIALLGMITSYIYTRSLLKLAGISLLTICLSGSFESIEPLFLTTLLFLYFKLKSERKSQDQPIIWYCFILNMICIFFVLSAEGTHYRVNLDISRLHGSAIHALFRSFESVAYYFTIFILSPYNILAILIIISSKKKNLLIFGPIFQRLNLYKIILLIIFLAVILCVLTYFPNLYLESDLPMPRITTVIFIIFALSLAGILISADAFLNKTKKLLSASPWKNVLWIAFMISVIFSNNFLKVSSDLFSGTALRFNQEQNKRYSDLRACLKDTCYIDPIKNWPSSIQQGHRETDVDNSTLYLDIYFNKKKIVIKQQ